MRNASDRLIFRLYAEQFNEEKRAEFEYLAQGGHYTSEQKAYAFQLIEENGIRTTAKIPKNPAKDTPEVVQRIPRVCQTLPILGL